MINIKPLRDVKPFSHIHNALRILKEKQYSDDVLNNLVKVAYDSDLIIAEENEKIVLENTVIIDSIVKTLNTAGVYKIISVYKTSRSSKKANQDAAWWDELKTTYPSSYNPLISGYSKAYLTQLYQIAIAEKKTFDDAKAIEKERNRQEEDSKRKKQQEAIIIAHTCLKFHLDPSSITTETELEKALMEIGEVPKSIISNLKTELNFNENEII